MPRIGARAEGACWTVPEIAEHLRVSAEKVVRLIEAGRLAAYDTEPDRSKRRAYRIPPAALEAYLAAGVSRQPITAPRGRRRRG